MVWAWCSWPCLSEDPLGNWSEPYVALDMYMYTCKYMYTQKNVYIYIYIFIYLYYVYATRVSLEMGYKYKIAMLLGNLTTNNLLGG
jgi:hypothetical protein